MALAYTKGLHELGDGLHAYLQPNGGWGWSNAGLVTSEGGSLLVDTLFDLKLTQDMLDAMAAITADHPIESALNTHANGDHCFGNQLLPPGVTLYGTPRAIEEMQAAPPNLVHLLFKVDHGDPVFTKFAQEKFGPFDWEGVELRVPSETWEGRLELRVGEREVTFIELGPAHTGSDSIVHVPDAGVVFTGDLLFIGGTPIVWEGTYQNWLDACETILSLEPRLLVPGHGPPTDEQGVRGVMRYLEYVRAEARKRFDAGMDAEAAADDIDLGEFADWSDSERIAVNVEAAYREFDPGREPPAVPELFVRMARWSDRH
ncbi:MAG TPA: MBL fold metallo-hydrolase [Thermoleophilaceae bacterium]|jgi:glyoxylase-like metal-dependent hydrolase (beta-lactamase superfamily II)